MMRSLLLYSLLLFSLCISGCVAVNRSNPATETIAASALQPYGRTLLNSAGQLELISSAAHFGFSFEGTECRIDARLPSSQGHNYLQFEMDGSYGHRIKVFGGKDTTIILRAAKTGKHTVWIYKATEAHTGPIAIAKITATNIQPLQKKAAPLIEFIGNSITCGAAADASEVACGTGVYHDQHNAYYAYGPRVARALGIQFIMSSVSGIGIYRNWNSDGPTMPQVYESTSFQPDDKGRWDFTKYAPQVVSIALGTNDFSNGDGVKKRLPFDSAAFVRNYIQFVQLVQSKYPAAQIALLSSPMIKGSARQTLHNCLAAVKQQVDAANPQAKKLAVHLFKPMNARGCTGHPSVEDHAILAEELLPFFKILIK
ncbi:SGNH/GDSL hydrolase family protein [Paracnuella aquatica]|uniref:SGNH/GDSL hydrolase family protein n=1 Tax=Paracnuella aquatica TaxID=2268757 RepID=UPI000DEFBDB9|nr:SGNH/GDSL hydrolase family protein [Paracnuella aquatica]RPD47347.1 GDSL family lipase [Paracnuella aquatica]